MQNKENRDSSASSTVISKEKNLNISEEKSSLKYTSLLSTNKSKSKETIINSINTSNSNSSIYNQQSKSS